MESNKKIKDINAEICFKYGTNLGVSTFLLEIKGEQEVIRKASSLYSTHCLHMCHGLGFRGRPE